MLLATFACNGFLLPSQGPIVRAGQQRTAIVLMAEAKAMSMKELKAELDALGVAWKGVCFEKEDLVRALEEARAAPNPAPTAPSPPPPPSSPPPSADERFGGFGSAVAQAEAEAAEVNAMSIDEIKKELAELGAEIASEDKAELVSELLNARAFNRPMFDTTQFGNQGTQW